MSYQPFVPTPGLGGYIYLKRTRAEQQAVFEKQAELSRNAEAFNQKIASVSSADDLISDRQLLTVALTAFGLEEDINSTFLIKKILESDPNDHKSLVSRFADKRYRAINEAFQFYGTTNQVEIDASSAKGISNRYIDRSFEIAIGETDQNLRLALAFSHEFSNIISPSSNDKSNWYNAMGSQPVRRVLEGALGLPGSFGSLDLDRQLEEFSEKLERKYGITEISQANTEENLEKITRDFLVRSELDNLLSSNTSGAGIALALLSQ